MMKAYRIHNDIVAANDADQAIATWALYFEESPAKAGPVEELNPAEFEVHYEEDDGSFKPGPLTHCMPTDGQPAVIIEGECKCCGSTSEPKKEERFPQFEFVEFNSRRKARGVEAARVKVRYEPGESAVEVLWMSAKDIRANLADYGPSEGLEKALAAYTA